MDRDQTNRRYDISIADSRNTGSLGDVNGVFRPGRVRNGPRTGDLPSPKSPEADDGQKLLEYGEHGHVPEVRTQCTGKHSVWNTAMPMQVQNRVKR